MAGTRVSLLPSATPRSSSLPAVSCLPHPHSTVSIQITVSSSSRAAADTLTCLCRAGRSCQCAVSGSGKCVSSGPPRSLPGVRWAPPGCRWWRWRTGAWSGRYLLGEHWQKYKLRLCPQAWFVSCSSCLSERWETSLKANRAGWGLPAPGCHRRRTTPPSVKHPWNCVRRPRPADRAQPISERAERTVQSKLVIFWNAPAPFCASLPIHKWCNLCFQYKMSSYHNVLKNTALSSVLFWKASQIFITFFCVSEMWGVAEDQNEIHTVHSVPFMFVLVEEKLKWNCSNLISMFRLLMWVFDDHVKRKLLRRQNL